jgi:hypothetical protein
VVAEIKCAEKSWTVEIADAAIGETTMRRRLPEHEPCDKYQVALSSAVW